VDLDDRSLTRKSTGIRRCQGRSILDRRKTTSRPREAPGGVDPSEEEGEIPVLIQILAPAVLAAAVLGSLAAGMPKVTIF
jgi:hypothetical protein